jgi:hypothetical protein
MQTRQNKKFDLEKNDQLWRYIDLHQLLYFLNTETIFFAPLSSFEDPLEGFSKKNFAVVEGEERSVDKNFDHRDLREQQQLIYASCWFLGDSESMAMWETHSNPDSVALKFNARQLIDLILCNAENLQSEVFTELTYGKVDYIKLFELTNKELEKYNHEFIGFLKDKSYKHEEEFRFIVTQAAELKKEFRGFDLPSGSLRELEFEIITHPRMESWKHENLQKVLKNFSVEKKLRRSQVVVKG